MELVRGNREQITTDLLHIDGHLASGLYRVGMEINVSLSGNATNLLDRLEHAGFIVCHHDRNELGVWTQRTLQLIGIDQSATINRQVSHFRPALLEALAGIQNRMVFNLGSNDVVTGMSQSENSKIVTFSTAAGENNLRSPAT